MSVHLGSLFRVLRDLAGRDRLLRELERRGSGIRIHRTVEVRSPARLTLGSEIFVDRGVLLHCGGMEWSASRGGISVGARTYIGPNSVLFGAGEIEIGESVLISPGVVITSHQHTYRAGDDESPAEVMRNQPVEFEPVVIERDVWIGANATILPGVRVGEGSVVGAGAVVTRDVRRRSVVLGVPARVVRDR